MFFAISLSSFLVKIFLKIPNLFDWCYGDSCKHVRKAQTNANQRVLFEIKRDQNQESQLA